MNAIESTKHYKDRIKAELENTLTTTSFTKGTKKTGKVRDQYDLGDKIAPSQLTVRVLLTGCWHQSLLRVRF